MKIILILLAIGLLARVAWSYFGTRNIEKPKIISSSMMSGWVELREIAPMIQATVISTWSQNQALNNGFRQLAWYIFGANKKKNSIAMTAPVSSSKAETIAMTAPVGSQKIDQQYRISFTMPSSYTLENLPEPINSNIKFEQLPAKSYYVWKFSGLANETRANNQFKLFQQALKDQWIQGLWNPILNQYNDPRTIWFMRVNERRIEK